LSRSSAVHLILAEKGIDQAVADALGCCGVRLGGKAEADRVTSDAKFHNVFITVILLLFSFAHDAASIK